MSECESEANEPEAYGPYAYVEQVLNEDTGRILLPNRPTFEKGETTLHEEDHSCACELPYSIGRLILSIHDVRVLSMTHCLHYDLYI